MSEEVEQADGPSLKDLLSALWPLLAGAVITSVLAAVVLMRFAPIAAPLRTQAPAVVTFDVMQYINAQRAVASAFLKQGSDHTNAVEALSDLPSRTREAISEVAGPGVLVVAKQFVVQGATRDITAEVLKKLGLPYKNVPTSDVVRYTLDEAPTMFMVAPPAYVPRPLPGEKPLGNPGSALP
jgi:hypothetical protein